MNSNKKHSVSSKTSSCRFSVSASSSKTTKSKPVTHPRKVLPSKKISQIPSADRKVCSAGVLNENKIPTKPKKTTKSDFGVRKQNYEPVDFCRRCGDVPSYTNTTNETKLTLSNTSTNKSVTSVKIVPEKPAKPIKEYYKNENYRPSTDSMQNITNGTKKIYLDTITEVPEMHQSGSVFKIYPESEEDVTFIDTDDQETLEQLKEFRQKNYFECHSAKSRVRSKASATSLQDHKCVYRFYLNDRLFPVPLSTDHNNHVRCVECHLPMELNVEESGKINGTIQAKVTLGKQMQDLMLLLPVREPLIITEKRKEEKKDKEIIYFGVINLDGFGNSMFNPTIPTNSFALKYQKGYKTFEVKEEYSYKDFDKNDVIVI